MKGPTTSPYQGQNLNNQTAGAFTGALGVANDQLGIGQAGLGAGAGLTGDAASLFRDASGLTPGDITAGQLSNTNLSPYMNPFQQDVIDTTMSELGRQERISNQGVNDAFTASKSFGGDRQAVYNAENARNFRDQRAGILSQLNSANFNNAQQMARGDIDRRFGADQANQGMRQGMFQFGAGGLGNTGQNLLGMGSQLYNPANLSSLAGQGFGFADTIAKNNLQAGTLQQQQMQALLDAAKAQWSEFTNKPLQGLGAITGATTVPNGSVTKNNPGILGILGTGAQAVGAML